MSQGGLDRELAASDDGSLNDIEERPARVGRKRDDTLDGRILDATLEVLAEVGYDGLTMDMVAARAKSGKATLYRRWPSKEEMVLEAVALMKRDQVDLDDLPDTGSLRSDLLGMFKAYSVEEQERRMKIMMGLATMLLQHQRLVDAGSAAIVEPWADAHRIFIRRAMDRGEVSADADIETASQIIPSMAAYRSLIQRKPFERDFLVSLVDGVLLPALRYEPTQTQRSKDEGD